MPRAESGLHRVHLSPPVLLRKRQLWGKSGQVSLAVPWAA